MSKTALVPAKSKELVLIRESAAESDFRANVMEQLDEVARMMRTKPLVAKSAEFWMETCEKLETYMSTLDRALEIEAMLADEK
jgi:hypothetical protein